jgi:hypothetical protein
MHIAAVPRVAPHAYRGQALAVPGLPGQTVVTRFTWTASDAAFHNELGLFLVDDPSGRIGNLRPGSRGYVAAALAPSRRHVIFARGQAAGAVRTLELPAGRFFGMYLIQNGTTADFLAHNRRNRLTQRPVAVFGFTATNPDGRVHMQWLSGNVFAWDDGGDAEHDFGDLTASIHFGPPRGTPQGAPAPTPTPGPKAPLAPPVLTARLSDDTAPGGTTDSDGITSDPAVAGTVIASAALTSLRAGFDAMPPASFTDVTSALQPGGQFALNRARLAQVDGGTLPDGHYTLHLVATDANGSTGTFDLPFLLDTQPPAVTFQEPRPGLATNNDPTVSGRVTDNLSGVAALQAQLDGGTPLAVRVGADGSFRFPITLPLDRSADGAHTVHLRATDVAGNVSSFDYSFTLDTTPPAVAITSPAAQLTTNARVTVTGRATDALSGVASLQAQVDGGAFTAVALDAGGSFSFPVTLPLDGSADGAHTVRFRATDAAGNVSALVPVSFTLDTTAPLVVITTPAPGLISRANVTVAGRVSDSLDNVTSLQAQLDGGAAMPVTFDTTGDYSFATTLAVDGSADGSHTVSLRATDEAGNQSALTQATFALDTTPPVVALTSPAAGTLTATNVTVAGRVTDAVSGVASLEAQVDAGAFAPVTLDTSGNFSFPTALALDGSADGGHTLTLRATDRAGNAGTVQVPFTLESGLLREGSAFHTSREQDLTIPAGPSVLTFPYSNLAFDTNPQPGIRDAFEAALVDANGQPLVHTIAAGRDAFFNVTDGQAPALGAEAALSGQAVTLNLAGITPGTSARLIYRLINNDNDGTPDTSVDVTAAQVLPNPGGQPVAVTPAAAAVRTAGLTDLSTLSDVSGAFTPEYGQTAFDEADSVLYAHLALRNAGTYRVGAPLAVAVAHLSDPSVRVRGADGVTPDGLPYYPKHTPARPPAAGPAGSGPSSGGTGSWCRPPSSGPPSSPSAAAPRSPAPGGPRSPSSGPPARSPGRIPRPARPGRPAAAPAPAPPCW